MSRAAVERWVLWQLGAHGPIGPAALAARMKLDPTRLRAFFDALGRRGYVRPDAQGLPDLTSSGRRALIALTRAAHTGTHHPK